LRAPVEPFVPHQPESVPDISRESVALPQAPVVKDLNVSQWTPAAPAKTPMAAPSAVQPEITEEDYRNIVDRSIRNSVKYPDRAKKRNLQGRVTISVTIGADGEITALKVTQSSGHRILDRSVLKAVKSSAPFSSPPDGPVTVIVPIQFRLI
jgi:protein TonB